MTTIPLAVTHSIRTLGRTPPMMLVNMFVEKDPSNAVDGLARLQRPALALFATLGTGPIRGVYRQAGTFNGDYLVVSGLTLYRVTAGGIATALRAITGTGRVIIAASGTRALIATGGDCFSTDGVTVTTIDMPSAEQISSTAFMDGYFILTVVGSNRFFWLAPGDVNPDALSFASAENSPDGIVIVLRLVDELWFLGQSSIEVFQATGNSDAPFQRIGGRLYERGCDNANAACVLDNTIFWVGDDLSIYRAEAAPAQISDHGIEERLRAADPDDISIWAFKLDGHTFLVVRAGDEGTYVHDLENKTWSRWQSYLQNTWRPWCGAQRGQQILAGDDATGKLWVLNQALSNDDGQPIVREITGYVPADAPQRCDSVELFCATGWEDNPEFEPLVELNWYDDGGFALDGPWVQMSLGRRGQRGLRLVARQLGLMEPPGRLFAIRMSGDTMFRLSYAKMNEARGA